MSKKQLDRIEEKLDQNNAKLDALLDALADDDADDEPEFDLDGNHAGYERDPMEHL